MSGESTEVTWYAVRCRWNGCNNGEPIYITREEYRRQMSRPNDTWRCPRCGDDANWDDDAYDLIFSEDQPL